MGPPLLSSLTEEKIHPYDHFVLFWGRTDRLDQKFLGKAKRIRWTWDCSNRASLKFLRPNAAMIPGNRKGMGFLPEKNDWDSMDHSSLQKGWSKWFQRNVQFISRLNASKNELKLTFS
jgi:hypothetical protein